MSLITTVGNLFQQNRQQMLAFRLDKEHVDKTDDYVEMEAGKHYVRIWLSEMFLKTQVWLGQQYDPAVHSVVKFDFGDSTVEIPTVADVTKVGLQNTDGGDVIARRFVMTPLIPFNGGTIAVDTGLVAVAGQNNLDSLISTLSDFSGLLAVPQFSLALNVAGPLARGMQTVFGNGGLHLGLKDTFANGNLGGYHAIIRATQQQVDTRKLWVFENQLRSGFGPTMEETVAFEWFDYMLIRVELREERDDFDKLTAIQEPFVQAIDALQVYDETKAESYFRAAVVATHKAPELTKADRSRVIRALKADFNRVKEDLGFAGLVGSERPLLPQIMSRAMSVDLALEMGVPSFDEIFGA